MFLVHSGIQADSPLSVAIRFTEQARESQTEAFPQHYLKPSKITGIDLYLLGQVNIEAVINGCENLLQTILICIIIIIIIIIIISSSSSNSSSSIVVVVVIIIIVINFVQTK